MGYALRNNRKRKKNPVRTFLAAGILFLVIIIAISSAVLIVKFNRPTAPVTPPDPVVDTPPIPALSLPLPQSFVDNNTASKYIALYDLTADKVLYSKNADERCYPASMTKLLTAAVAVKYAPAETVFTVGEEIRLIDPESSVAYLRIGNRLDMQTMLEALLLPSGNDAAYTIAANVGRIIANDPTLSAGTAIQTFCNKMNETAKELGCKNSHFANPDGIHNANHYTTAADMLLIAKNAYREPLIAAVMAEEKVTRTFLSGETGATWYNTNYLLRSDTRYLFEGANGMKTGHTGEAGYCLAASAQKDGAVLIAVLMGAEQSYGRFEDATGLFTVCFDTLPQTTEQPVA